MTMLETDSLTYSYQKRSKASVESRPSERKLLTIERSQKLDLLIHLLTNLQKALIISGPPGIGKTFLMNTFQETHNKTWPICMLQGSSALSFESVISQLSLFLNLSNTRTGFDISSLRTFCEHQKVILVIDNATDLVSGLIGELIDFAGSMKGLRLVFSMNDDEFQRQSGSDKVIETCHFIELPPLNQQQCLEFLQNLSALPNANLSFNAINDELVEAIYHRTEGIPGKLLAEIPKLGEYQSHQNRKLGLWLGASLIIATGFSVYNFGFISDKFKQISAEKSIKPAETLIEPSTTTPVETRTEQTTQIESTVIPPVNTLIRTPSLPEAPQMPKAPIEQWVDNATKPNSTPEPELEVSKATDMTKPTQLVISEKNSTNLMPEKIGLAKPNSDESPASTLEKNQSKAKPQNSQSDEGDLLWINAQPADNFTLQVMVLSSRTSANRFLKKYPEHKDQIKYYPIGQTGHEKYVLIFGSFSSNSEALQQKANLPTDFNQGLVKPFRLIQKESRRKL